MDVEFHQLDLRLEHLRARSPQRQRRLLSSLAEMGQQTPIVVVAVADELNRYVVIDGFKRIVALQQLGRDTVEAVVWPMGEVEALVLERSLRLTEQETALEQGWMLAELEARFGYGLEDLARRFDRDVSWVSRRLALVEILPQSIQQQVREGALRPHVAMKYLVPVARASIEDCERMAAAFARGRWSTREAGQLYAAWREGSPAVRKRLLDHPELLLKSRREIETSPPQSEVAELMRDLEMVTAIANRAGRGLRAVADQMDESQYAEARRKVEIALDGLRDLGERIEQEKQRHVEQRAAHDDPGASGQGREQGRDLPPAGDLAPISTQGSAGGIGRAPRVPPAGEGRAAPTTDPRALRRLQGQSRAGP